VNSGLCQRLMNIVEKPAADTLDAMTRRRKFSDA
jgi:hypothetical protein